jgi:YHS domain-containing protein
MKKPLSVLTALIVMWAVCFISTVGANAASPAQSAQKTEAVIPLEGLDPVMLVQGKEVQGLEKFSVTRGNFQYLFASAENKALFEKDPARYEIQLEGTCARMGPSTGGNPDLFTVYKERIYVFGSGDCKKKFDAAPQNYLESEQEATLKVAATPEALKKGQWLIDKAVDAIGGASKIDGLVSYQEKSTTIQKGPQGDFEIKAIRTIIFPDRVRLERTLRFGNVVDVLSPGESFTVFPGGLRSMSAPQRADQERQLKRNQVAILRARKGSSFRATAMGPGKVGEAAVEQVAVNVEGSQITLGIEPSSGRILSLSYKGRGTGGAYGNIVRSFSDFRTIEGLTLPFITTTTFNGELTPDLSPTVEALTINGKVDPAIFKKPKATSEQ